MPLRVVMTVGTSLLTNKDEDKQKPRFTEVQNLERVSGDWKTRAECPEAEIQTGAQQILGPLRSFLTETAVSRELAHRRANDPQKKDRLPQELSYLALLAQEGSQEEREGSWPAEVVLLASDTVPGRLCAWVLHGVLQDEERGFPWNRYKNLDASPRVIEGLATDPLPSQEGGSDAADTNAAARVFETQGVPNLIAELQRACAGGETILINLSGGFKGAIPFSTLASAFIQAPYVTLDYLFDGSTRIIHLPSYPIGLDFTLWHQDATLLDAYPAHPRIYGSALAPRLRAAAEELRHHPDAASLPRLLQKAYEKQRTTDPLIQYSKAIIGRLLHPAGPYVGGQRADGGRESGQSWDDTKSGQLQEILIALVERAGDTIWLGDKLPEMVDHALRHHHNLLELTEQFLLPILYHDPDFLNPRERFVLLSTVLLHDSGHSLDRIKVADCEALAHLFGAVEVTGLGDEIPLWPGDIRDYHQYLSGLRLNDTDLAADLGWPHPDLGAETPLPHRALHDAVILACLYHRRRMAYDGEGQDQKADNCLHLTGQWPGPLKERAKPIQEEIGVDLMKVVALMRLIDGCDSQARRAGSEAHIRLGQTLLARDYETAAQRAVMAYDMLADGDSRKAAILPPRSQVVKGGVSRTTTAWEVNDGQRTVRMCALAELQANTSLDAAQAARMWLLAAEAAERAFFRSTPWPHFIKHQAVARVRVLPDADFGPQNFHFHIILEENRAAEKQKNPLTNVSCTLSEWLNESEHLVFPPQTLRRTIEDEVSSEYKQVAAYALGNFHLQASFQWDGEKTAFYPRPSP